MTNRIVAPFRCSLSLISFGTVLYRQYIDGVIDLSVSLYAKADVFSCRFYPVGFTIFVVFIKFLAMEYYYVYVLLSQKDANFYTGYSKDITNRIKMHNAGNVLSTKLRRPLTLVYWEGCLNQQDATRREKYLKSGNGKIYLKSRLRNYLDNPTG